MTRQISVRINVTAGDADEVRAKVAPLLDALARPVTAQTELEPYYKIPGTWMISLELGTDPGDDAAAIVTGLAERTGLTGWQVSGDANLADAGWDDRAGPAPAYPGVTWIAIDACRPPDPAAEPPQLEELTPDSPFDDPLEAAAHSVTIGLSLRDPHWDAVADGAVVVTLTAPDAREAVALAAGVLTALDAQTCQDPWQDDSGAWNVLAKIYAPAESRVPLLAAKGYADLVGGGGWSYGGGETGYAARYGDGNPLHRILIAVP